MASGARFLNGFGQNAVVQPQRSAVNSKSELMQRFTLNQEIAIKTAEDIFSQSYLDKAPRDKQEVIQSIQNILNEIMEDHVHVWVFLNAKSQNNIFFCRCIVEPLQALIEGEPSNEEEQLEESYAYFARVTTFPKEGHSKFMTHWIANEVRIKTLMMETLKRLPH